MSKRSKGVRWSLPLIVLSLLGAAGCSGDPAMVRLIESRRLAADLHWQFTKATDAANRAVMASDERATGFASDAEQAKQGVQSTIDALGPLLQGLRYADETQLLQEFSSRFAEYRALDRQILELAVENTNLKAQRLSFGPALQSADAFRDALESLSVAGGDRWRVHATVNAAVSRVREIQAIQAPHIASDSDDTMTGLEQRMAAAEAAARAALAALSPLVAAGGRPTLAGARTELDRFMGINAEIVALSRRNTNVHSLALTLNEKGKLTSVCDERLQALEEALGTRQTGGTR